MSLWQLLGVSGRSVPALRKRNRTPHTTQSSERTADCSIETAEDNVHWYRLVERGQGRAAGAAEDHMKCLELLAILRAFTEKNKRVLTAALQHLSALPVQLLRQVYLSRRQLSLASALAGTNSFNMLKISS